MIQKFQDFKDLSIIKESEAPKAELTTENIEILKQIYGEELTDELKEELSSELQGMIGIGVAGVGVISTYILSLVQKFKEAKKKDPEASDTQLIKQAFDAVGKSLDDAHK